MDGKANGTHTSLAAVSTGAASAIGNPGTGAADGPFPGYIAEVRLYNRELSDNEQTLLASKIGVAHTIAPRRRASVQVAASFNRRRRLLVGAGS